MKLRSIIFASLAAAALSASAQTYSGTTDNLLTWNRPAEGTLAAPSAISNVGTNTHYQALPVTVTKSGNYSITSTPTSVRDWTSSALWDNCIYLYKGTFTATSPLVNIVIGNDDKNLVSGSAGIDSVNLVAGQAYTMVTTGFTNFDKGSYTNVISDSTSGQLITGTVDLQSWSASLAGQIVTVQIQSSGVAVASFTVTLDASGSYSFYNTLSGNYDIAFQGSHWLRKKIANVSISSSTSTNVSASLINGDIDGNNVVNINDYSVLSDHFGAQASDPDWSAVGSNGLSASSADLDGNGIVNINDYAILSDNFNLAGD